MASRKKPAIVAAPTAALAAVGAPTIIPALALPADFGERHRDVLALAATYADPGTIDTPDEYAIIDAGLQSVVRAKDQFIALRQGCVGAMRKVVATVEAEFRPGVKALEAAEAACKRALGAYKLAEAERERAARAAALAAANTGDAEALTEALTTASVAGAGAHASGTATVATRWVIDRIAEGLLPDEYWSPDTAKINAEIARQGGLSREEAPVIPGVIFKREARVGARR
jgi:hypothetical protein